VLVEDAVDVPRRGRKLLVVVVGVRGGRQGQRRRGSDRDRGDRGDLHGYSFFMMSGCGRVDGQARYGVAVK
jgi:hypothetical protein